MYMKTEGGPASSSQTATGGEPQQPIEVEAQKQTQVALKKKKGHRYQKCSVEALRENL